MLGFKFSSNLIIMSLSTMRLFDSVDVTNKKDARTLKLCTPRPVYTCACGYENYTNKNCKTELHTDLATGEICQNSGRLAETYLVDCPMCASRAIYVPKCGMLAIHVSADGQICGSDSIRASHTIAGKYMEISLHLDVT